MDVYASAISVSIKFAGPFSWAGSPDARSVFDAPEGKESGVYLWTVPTEVGHVVYYVGETGRSFEERLFEHYKEHASGMYHLYNPSEFVRGVKKTEWPGLYDRRARKTVRDCIAEYGRINQVAAELTSLYRFFFAPLSCGRRERCRIEAAISDFLRKVPGIVGDMQDEGIRYSRRLATEEEIACPITSTAPIAGLPSHIVA